MSRVQPPRRAGDAPAIVPLCDMLARRHAPTATPVEWTEQAGHAQDPTLPIEAYSYEAHTT